MGRDSGTKCLPTRICTEKGSIKRPTAFDHKSRMRLIEHGTDWTQLTDARLVLFGLGLWVLLQSQRTGYLKWWPASSC